MSRFTKIDDPVVFKFSKLEEYKFQDLKFYCNNIKIINPKYEVETKISRARNIKKEKLKNFVSLKDKLLICNWFTFGIYDRVNLANRLLINIKTIDTIIKK